MKQGRELCKLLHRNDSPGVNAAYCLSSLKCKSEQRTLSQRQEQSIFAVDDPPRWLWSWHLLFGPPGTVSCKEVSVSNIWCLQHSNIIVRQVHWVASGIRETRLPIFCKLTFWVLMTWNVTGNLHDTWTEFMLCIEAQSTDNQSWELKIPTKPGRVAEKKGTCSSLRPGFSSPEVETAKH